MERTLTAIMLLMVLIGLGVTTPISMAQDHLDTPDLSAAETGEHHTYRLAKPDNFESKERWVQDNYTDHLLQTSLKPVTRDGVDAVSFWTIQDGIYDHNFLFEQDDLLVLQTTSVLDVVADSDGDFVSEKAARRAAASCDTSTNRCNCVLYTRCLVRSLPYGLIMYSDKARIINSSTPTVGSVAVMNIYPPYGHVAIVSAVRKDRSGRVTVTLNEANYRKCQVTTTRTGTAAGLKITGYFKP